MGSPVSKFRAFRCAIALQMLSDSSLRCLIQLLPISCCIVVVEILSWLASGFVSTAVLSCISLLVYEVLGVLLLLLDPSLDEDATSCTRDSRVTVSDLDAFRVMIDQTT